MQAETAGVRLKHTVGIPWMAPSQHYLEDNPRNHPICQDACEFYTTEVVQVTESGGQHSTLR